MIGNSLLSRIQEKIPALINVGCVCHLANLCVQAAAKTLSVPDEEVLTDIFFHFHHSAKQKEVYKEFQAFMDTEPMKNLKHCANQWLGLEKWVKRALQQWPALRRYFVSHEDDNNDMLPFICKLSVVYCLPLHKIRLQDPSDFLQHNSPGCTWLYLERQSRCPFDRHSVCGLFGRTDITGAGRLQVLVYDWGNKTEHSFPVKEVRRKPPRRGPFNEHGNLTFSEGRTYTAWSV
ncbi:hypothetical protein MAR_034671 [Mya arenaria]|uniref:Uncharacterized protein n=1 Tax=Mya arenaria TaxID=6604 RepID=A0ABY7EKA3_MYAAR|nr:hypothetical protein MAR_034671 [Mya arenaria]